VFAARAFDGVEPDPAVECHETAAIPDGEREKVNVTELLVSADSTDIDPVCVEYRQVVRPELMVAVFAEPSQQESKFGQRDT
jgi:hypothetical protein